MSTDILFDRPAETSVAILPVLTERWSPRSFQADEPVEETKLAAALEAARWSPSAGNSQPWRFIVARRGSDAFSRIVATLRGANGAWAGSAGALVVAAYEASDAEGTLRPWAQYDLGQAMAHFSIQAHADGLHVHTMGGFDADAVTEAFALPENVRPLSVTAVGSLAPAHALTDEALIAREGAPRTRRALDEIVIVDA
jgi:nitroreductase